MTTASFCHSCGRLALPGAAFCAYCGVRLDRQRVKSAPSATGRAVRPPAPDQIVGECAVVATSMSEESIPAVGRLVAKVTETPLPDVTRDIRNSRGVLARGLSKEKGRELAEHLREVGIEAFALGEESFVRLPAPQRMRKLAFGESGFKCEAYTWDRTREIEARWERVLLVAGARLQVTEVMEAEPKKKPERRRLRFESLSDRIEKRVPKLETRVRYEMLLDVVLFKPWERLRLDENAAAYALAEQEQDYGAAVRAAASQIYSIEHDAPCDPGLELLATRAPEEAWARHTFESKAEFDAYVEWLTQLVRYGYDVPR